MTELTDRNKCEANVSELKPWLWKPGQSGNPAGRPVGARNRLAETFLEDLYRDWQEHVDVVNEVLEGLSLDGQSIVHVFNKMDLVSDARDFEEHVTARYENAVCVTAEREKVAPLVELLRVLAPRPFRLA